MKSTVAGLTLLLLATLTWAAEPTSQAQPGAAAPTAQAQAQTGAPKTPPAKSTPLVDLGFTPKPLFATGCTADVQCPLSGGTTTTLSCSGASSCSIGEYWVTCDGHTTYCGCVGCDLCQCDCLSGGGTGLQCSRECRFNC